MKLTDASQVPAAQFYVVATSKKAFLTLAGRFLIMPCVGLREANDVVKFIKDNRSDVTRVRVVKKLRVELSKRAYELHTRQKSTGGFFPALDRDAAAIIRSNEGKLTVRTYNHTKGEYSDLNDGAIVTIRGWFPDSNVYEVERMLGNGLTITPEVWFVPGANVFAVSQ